jgi:hypothetical protein|tara:strand:- start:131 stop:898 length:768 start_codon:yes stop_codon:yes gene_type:complete
MKKIILTFLTFILTFSVSENSIADDHMEVSNLQIQLCNLNDGVTMKEYDAMISEYFEWAKENDVETYFARQTALYPHNSFIDAGYDFVELLNTSHVNSGKGWDKWLGTKSGQKLNEKWQKLANCKVKMAAIVPNFLNEKALSEDKDRIVSWNWCSLNDGVSYEDLLEEHSKRASSLEENSRGLIAWANVYPRIGMSEAPGDFAHLALFPNIEAAQVYQQDQSDGGWKSYRDYNQNFASCEGDQFMIEKVLSDPNN